MKKPLLSQYLDKRRPIEAGMDLTLFDIEESTFFNLLGKNIQYFKQFSPQQLDYIIDKSNMNLKDSFHRSVAFQIFYLDLVGVLSDKQFLSILTKSDLTSCDKYGNFLFNYFIHYNQQQPQMCKNKTKTINYLVEHSPYQTNHCSLVHFLKNYGPLSQENFNKLVMRSQPVVGNNGNNRLQAAISVYKSLKKSTTSSKCRPKIMPEHWCQLMYGIINEPLDETIFKETVLSMEPQDLTLIWPYIENKYNFVDRLIQYKIDVLNKEIFDNIYLKAFRERKCIEENIEKSENRKVSKI